MSQFHDSDRAAQMQGVDARVDERVREALRGGVLRTDVPPRSLPLSKLAQGGAASGDAPVWDGARWAPGGVATQVELDAHVNDTSGAHQASAIDVTESGIIIPGAMSVQQAMRAIEFQAEQLRQQLASHHHDERYQQRIPLAYTAVSFGTNWSNYGTWRTAGYAKSQDGVVHLAGLIQRAAASGADLLTLPVGHRPSAPLLFTLSAVIGGVSTIVRVDLQTTGVLQAIGFPASFIDYLSLNEIPPFIAEQ